ncbi:MAG: imidazole glycerol phosphate synthase subunit HisH [Geminicoccaceae bacterium]
MSGPVLIAPTGTANLASVKAALIRHDREVRLAETATDIVRATHVVLPGVGSFGASMANLAAAGLDVGLSERIARDLPTLCVCVGHQLLFEVSDESPGIRGLAVIRKSVDRFGDGVRVPQFGWNRMQGDGRVVRTGYAYFANSFRAVEAPGWVAAEADHGGTFIAAMERGNIIGCQFHPELSGSFGHDLIGRWLAC